MIKLKGRGHFRTFLRKTILLYYKGHGADIVCNSVGHVILVHKRLKYFFQTDNHIIERSKNSHLKLDTQNIPKKYLLPEQCVRYSPLI